jgi:hypothetical protein
VHRFEVWWLRNVKRARRGSADGVGIRVPICMLVRVAAAATFPARTALVIAASVAVATASVLNLLVRAFTVTSSFSMS